MFPVRPEAFLARHAVIYGVTEAYIALALSCVVPTLLGASYACLVTLSVRKIASARNVFRSRATAVCGPCLNTRRPALVSPTSGHDLRLDERLKSKRRQLMPPSEVESPARSGSSSEGGVTGSGSEVDMDWREEIRLASQLPEDGDAVGDGGLTFMTRE